jgi:GntR family transcriptional regulator, transcriptional repressor for pyruvate dehydrogenase complex
MSAHEENGRIAGQGEPARKAAAPQELLAPLAPARSLTEDLVQRLRGQILGGGLAPGARLPTEQQLVQSLGVSRTVVREAVAALRADGLVVTRQGVGAFVADHVHRRPFRIEPEQLTSLERVLDVMELRLAVETEAAALAAQRRRPADLQLMAAALRNVDAALARGEPAVEADFEFHRAIAAATGNAFFGDFLRYLGQFIIPRQSIRGVASTAEAQANYLRQVQAEHRVIVAAIRARDAQQAADQMRAHLVGSRERYRRLRDGLEATLPPAHRSSP